MPHNSARDATKAFFTSFDLHLNFTSGPLARVPSPSHPERVCVSPLPELSEIRDFPRSPVSLPPKPGIPIFDFPRSPVRREGKQYDHPRFWR